MRALRPLIDLFVALSSVMAADDVDIMDVTGNDFKRSASDSLLSPARPSAMRRTSELPMSPFASPGHVASVVSETVPAEPLEQPVSLLAHVPAFPIGSTPSRIPAVIASPVVHDFVFKPTHTNVNGPGPTSTRSQTSPAQTRQEMAKQAQCTNFPDCVPAR